MHTFGPALTHANALHLRINLASSLQLTHTQEHSHTQSLFVVTIHVVVLSTTIDARHLPSFEDIKAKAASKLACTQK